jgi:hypothetical protein
MKRYGMPPPNGQHRDLPHIGIKERLVEIINLPKFNCPSEDFNQLHVVQSKALTKLIGQIKFQPIVGGKRILYFFLQ